MSETTDAARTNDGLANLLTGQGGKSDSRGRGNRAWFYRPRTDQELLQLYQSHWLAAQVVEIPAFEMTRERRDWQLEDQNLLDQIEGEASRLCLWDRVREAVEWADLFGGAGILMGIEGAGEFEDPLDTSRIKPGSLRFLHTLDPRTLVPVGYDKAFLVSNPLSASFMLPESYQVMGSSLGRVHHSRIIRFPGVPLPWQEMQRTLWWGQSRIERMYDALCDAEQVIGGVADLVTEAKVDVYGIVGLRELLSTPEGEAHLRKRIEVSDQLKSMYQAIIRDSEEAYDQKQNAIVQGMTGLVEQYLVIVSAASGIPVTRLLGTSAKGLSATGEGDLRNFYDMIAARREAYLRPRLAQLDEVFVRSAIGKDPKDVRWEFGSLWQMDDAQQAEIEGKRAVRDEAYYRLGVIDELVIARQLKEEGTYAAITAEYVDDLEKELKELRASQPDPPAAPDPPDPDPAGPPESEPSPEPE